MDVRCNRCATEYDFDDALISERGTTVRCTNCGLEFRVFPNKNQQQSPDRWLVRTADRRELVFTSLRDLQRGIANREVGPEDLLSRGAQPPRTLGSIAELLPFFDSSARQPGHSARSPAATQRPGQSARSPAAAQEIERPVRTLQGVMAPLQGYAPEPTPPVPVVVPRPGASNPPRRAPSAPPATSQNVDARSAAAPFDSRAEPAPQMPLDAIPDEEDSPAPTAARVPSDEDLRRWIQPAANGADAAPNSAGALQTAAPMRAALGSGSFSTPEARSSPTASSPFGTGPVSSRRALRSYEEIADEATHGRRARSRWIAAVVIAGVTSLFAITVGRRYLLETAGLGASSESSSNARVAELLREGNRWIEAGDLEAASEPLLRASALAEKDHAVMAALARLETLRADLIWLKLRLLDPNVSELVQATHKELGRRVGKARTASDAAFAVAPEDIVVLRAKVDVLRLSGDAAQAREWLKPIAANSSDPQNAYVLAALDLAEPSPPWPALIDRLRVAANGERTPGRAHAALVYALARAGRLEDAQNEFSKMESNPNGAALADELRSFLKRFDRKPEPNAAPVPTVDPNQLGKLDTTPTPDERAKPSAEARPASGNSNVNEPAPSDFRRLLADAAQAMSRGDLSRAQDYYQRVLGQQPNNTEALAGLGDIARRRNDTAAAAHYYDRVLADNPSYLPALMAKADQHWAEGNRKDALTLYRKIVDQTSGSSDYGRRAAARIAEANAAANNAGSAPASPPDTPSANEPAPAPAPKAEPAPDIDTTDLPGLK